MCDMYQTLDQTPSTTTDIGSANYAVQWQTENINLKQEPDDSLNGYNACSSTTLSPPNHDITSTVTNDITNGLNGHNFQYGFQAKQLPPAYFQTDHNGFVIHRGYPPEYPQHPAQSPSPPLPPRRYKPCVVCNDKSSGFHYGVSSCEGCKGFFRRSVQKNMQYTCHKDQNCEINKITRNRCQYCRLQRCYVAGMSKEAVRNDRNKRRKKQDACVSSQQSEELTAAEVEVVNKLVIAHTETFPDTVTDDQFTMSQEDLDKQSDEADTFILWEKVPELSTKGIMKIVSFCKKVPGYLSLSTADQVTLLKSACLEIIVLRLASRYNDEDETVTVANNLILSKQHLETGGFGPLTNSIYKFAKALHALEVDQTEYALLSAICLISGDRSGLENVAKVEDTQEPLLEALKHYVRRRRSSAPHCFAKMLLKLTDLRSISVTGAERVLHLKSNMPTELPPLIIEMLDRAENVYTPKVPVSTEPNKNHENTTSLKDNLKDNDSVTNL